MAVLAEIMLSRYKLLIKALSRVRLGNIIARFSLPTEIEPALYASVHCPLIHSATSPNGLDHLTQTPYSNNLSTITTSIISNIDIIKK